jgi:hypothetical protein
MDNGKSVSESYTTRRVKKKSQNVVKLVVIQADMGTLVHNYPVTKGESKKNRQMRHTCGHMIVLNF